MNLQWHNKHYSTGGGGGGGEGLPQQKQKQNKKPGSDQLLLLD